MASNDVRNIILEVFGESKDAQASLEALAATLRSLPDATSIEVRAETERARQKLQAMLAELKAIDRTTVEPEVRAQITKAITELEAFDALLDDVDARHVEARLGVDVDRAALNEALAKAEAQIQAIAAQRRSVEMDFDIRTEKSERKLDELRRKLDKIPEERTVEMQLKAEGLEQAIAAEEAKLEAFTARHRSVLLNFDARTAAANAKIAALGASIEALPDDKTIDIDVNRGILADVATIDRGINTMVKSLDRVVPAAKQMEGALSGATTRIGVGIFSFGANLGALIPVIIGLAVVIGTALVGALGALISSFALAAAGAATLGTALAASLGPAVALVVAVVTRIVAVVEALKAQDAAAQGVAQKTVQGTQAATAALDQQAAAERALADAGAQMERAQVQALREMQDAAEAASDAIRGVADAELTLDDARLSIKEAELALRQLEEQAGAAGQGLVDKFTDIAVKFDASEINRAVVGGGGSEEDALRLERAILRVRQARQAEKNAVDGVSDAETKRSRAIEENNKFLKQGIAASQTYQAAARGVRDAEIQVARAQKASSAALDDLTAAQAKAVVLTSKLSDRERELVRVLQRSGAALQDAFGPATDRVLSGVIVLIESAVRLVNSLRGEFTQLGGAMGRALAAFGGELIQPAWIRALREFTIAGGKITEVFTTGLLIPFLRLVRDLTVAALPALQRALRGAGQALTRLSDQAGPRQLRDLVDGVVAQLGSWLRLTHQLGRVFLAFVRAGATEGRGLVETLADGARTLADFLNSTEGRNKLRQFFADTIPLAVEFLELLGKLMVLVFRLGQEAAPALTPLLKLLNDVLGLAVKITDVLSVLNPARVFAPPASATSAVDDHTAALDRLKDATDRQRDADDGAAQASRDLAAARRDARRAIKEAVSNAATAKLSARRSVFDLEDAKKELAALKRRGASQDEIARAQLRVDEATQRVKDATHEYKVAREESNKAQRDGIRNAQPVIDALDRERVANDRLREAIKNRRAEQERQALSRQAPPEADAGPLSGFGTSILHGEVPQVFKDIGRTLSDNLLSGFSSGFTLGDVVDVIVGIFRRAIDDLKAFLGISSPSTVFAQIGRDLISGLLQGLRERGGEIKRAIIGKLQGALDAVGELLDDAIAAGRSIGQAVADGIHEGLKTLGSIGRSVINTLITILNRGIGLINSVLPEKERKIGKGKLSITIPRIQLGEIPLLAGGGFLTGPTLFGGGESGEEAVVPFTNPAAMRRLAHAIAEQMVVAPTPVMAGAGRGALAPTAGGTGQTVHIDKMEIPVQAPAGQLPDARSTVHGIFRIIEHDLGGIPVPG